MNREMNSNQFFLTPTDPPSISKARTTGTPVGQKGVLQCEASAVPRPDFEWYKEDRRRVALGPDASTQCRQSSSAKKTSVSQQCTAYERANQMQQMEKRLMADWMSAIRGRGRSTSKGPSVSKLSGLVCVVFVPRR